MIGTPLPPKAFCPDCGAPIGAATGFHRPHPAEGFIWGHSCRTGRYWTFCVRCDIRESGATREDAMVAIDGTDGR